MKRNIVRVVKYVLPAGVIILLLSIFLPKNYNVPQLQKRAATQYMNLSTGSRIGYTMITAKGNKKPYPIIYLHGGPGGLVSDMDIDRLSPLSDDGYDIFLYDQVGSGQSARLNNIEEYTVQRHINDLNEIIKVIGAKKVILISQSWGAILACLFTADHPQQIEKIIFTSPGPVYPVRNELTSKEAPDSLHLRSPFFTNAQGNTAANNLRTKAMAFFAATFGKKIATDKEADNFATYLNYELNKSTVCDTSKIPKAEAGYGYYCSVMTFRSLLKVQDPRPKLKNAVVPVLIMKGECDNQQWGFTNEYLDLFPDHQLVIIPGAGHFISVEQPALYFQTIKLFLTQ